jgi:hypothetical protein
MNYKKKELNSFLTPLIKLTHKEKLLMEININWVEEITMNLN